MEYQPERELRLSIIKAMGKASPREITLAINQLSPEALRELASALGTGTSGETDPPLTEMNLPPRQPDQASGELKFGPLSDTLCPKSESAWRSGEVLLSHGDLSMAEGSLPTGIYSINFNESPVAYWFELKNRRDEEATAIIVKAVPGFSRDVVKLVIEDLLAQHGALFSSHGYGATTSNEPELSLTFAGNYPFHIRIADQTKSEGYPGSSVDFLNMFNPDLWAALVTTRDFKDALRGTLFPDFAGFREDQKRRVALFPFYLPEDNARSRAEQEVSFEPRRTPDAALIVEYDSYKHFEELRSSPQHRGILSAALIVPKNMPIAEKNEWVFRAHDYFQSLFGPRDNWPDDAAGFGVIPPTPTPVLTGEDAKSPPRIYITVPAELDVVGARGA